MPKVVLDTSEGKRIAEALGNKKAIILRNHGLLTVGHSVDEAAWWFITLERSCQAQLLAEAAGQPTPIDPKNAALRQNCARRTRFARWSIVDGQWLMANIDWE